MSRFRVGMGAATSAVALLLIAGACANGAPLAISTPSGLRARPPLIRGLEVTDDRLVSDSIAGGPLMDTADTWTQPGQSADFSAVVINPGYADIVFVSAAVIPLTGYRVPRLVHLGLVRAVPLIGSSLQSDSGWPPGSGLQVRPFAGASLFHGEVGVAFGMSGDTSGSDYAVAGLRIRYRVQGKAYYIMAWSAAVDCVNDNANLTSQMINACDSVSDNVDNMTSKMAGVISPLQYLGPS